MGMNLEDVLAQANQRSNVYITIVSNQDTGLVSYASGSVTLHPATGGQVLDGPPLRPARMESTAANPLSMFFSDRKLNIDPPPAPGSFGVSPRQPFSINATENLSVSIGPLFGDHQTISITISVFQSKTTFQMERLGNLYVGKGPPLGPSPEAVYILAFTGIFNPPA